MMDVRKCLPCLEEACQTSLCVLCMGSDLPHRKRETQVDSEGHDAGVATPFESVSSLVLFASWYTTARAKGDSVAVEFLDLEADDGTLGVHVKESLFALSDAQIDTKLKGPVGRKPVLCIAISHCCKLRTGLQSTRQR